VSDIGEPVRRHHGVPDQEPLRVPDPATLPPAPAEPERVPEPEPLVPA